MPLEEQDVVVGGSLRVPAKVVAAVAQPSSGSGSTPSPSNTGSNSSAPTTSGSKSSPSGHAETAAKPKEPDSGKSVSGHAAAPAAKEHSSQPVPAKDNESGKFLSTREGIRPQDARSETHPKSDSLGRKNHTPSSAVRKAAGVPAHLLNSIGKLAKLANHDGRPVVTSTSKRPASFSRKAELAYVARFHGATDPRQRFSPRGYNPRYAVERKSRLSAVVSDIGHGDIGGAAHDLIHGSSVLDDCTNFVSQALHAGGWKEDNKWKYEGQRMLRAARGVGVERAQPSLAWDNVKSFLSYALKSRRARLVPLSQARPGDIIILDQKGGRHFNADHAMIIVKGTGHGIEVAGHGANRYDYRFFGQAGSQSVMGTHQKAKYRFLHIKA